MDVHPPHLFENSTHSRYEQTRIKSVPGGFQRGTNSSWLHALARCRLTGWVFSNRLEVAPSRESRQPFQQKAVTHDLLTMHDGGALGNFRCFCRLHIWKRPFHRTAPTPYFAQNPLLSKASADTGCPGGAVTLESLFDGNENRTAEQYAVVGCNLNLNTTFYAGHRA